MRTFLILIFLVFVGGCCKCPGNDYTALFRIIRSSDQADLLFGPNKIYYPDSLKFYFLNGTDTVYFSSGVLNQSGQGFDSVIWVNLFLKTNTAYLKLNNNDIDTLDLEYFERKCCGDKYYSPGKVSYNHAATIKTGNYLVSVLTK